MDNDQCTEQKDDNMTKWLKDYKPLLREKMIQNINTRKTESEDTINKVISETLETQMDIKELVPQTALDQHDKIKPISIETDVERQFLSKLDKWTGLEKKCKDWKQYQDNGDGWFNRYKAQWFGDWFFYPLLATILPQYLQQLIEYNPKHSLNAKRKKAVYNFLYFSVLAAIIGAEVPFARTKYLPLISKQAFIQNRCRDTLQKLFINLGNQSREKFDNSEYVCHISVHIHIPCVFL